MTTTEAPATLFIGGRVMTMAPGAEPEVVLVVGDRISAVGGQELLAKNPTATVHDLAGSTLVPGFIDAHNHLSIAAIHPRWRDVSAVADTEALLAEVSQQARSEPDAPWIRVWGWDESVAGVTPTAADLDSLGLDRPIVVAHYSIHQAVVNSRGLDELGIGRTTPNPVGGEIVRGADGEATGLLLERAWGRAHALSLAGFTDPDLWADHIVARAEHLLASGITAVHDAACAPAAEVVYRQLAAAARLPISVLACPHPDALFDHNFGDRLDGPTTGEGDEWLRVGPAKFFADGGLEIALDVTIKGRPLRFGALVEDCSAAIDDAVDRGWGIAVHAIGNAAVESVIESYRRARRSKNSDARLRIEHVGVAAREQCRALADLGVIAVVQPGFVEHIGAQGGLVAFDQHAWLPFAWLAEAGVTLAASSDDPCTPFPPLWGASRGATRHSDRLGGEFDLDQAVDFPSWLKAYTAGAALAGGQEHERGTIAPGLRADLVVLEGELDPKNPPRVAETWVAGQQVYQSVRYRGRHD